MLTLKQSRQAALRGEAKVAIPALRGYADKGDASASASLAELLAFEGDWTECMQRAGEHIARPRSVYAGNVFNDMIRLLGRAGKETNRWERLAQLAHAAQEKVEENIAEDPPSKQEAERKRYRTILQALREYAQREGTPPHELIQVFGVARPTQAELDEAYQKAVLNVIQNRPDLSDNPLALSMHLFSLARNSNQEAEAIRLYEEGALRAHFDDAVFVAKAYVRRTQPERAWEVLWKHMSRWWPVDRAQVAPVILLVDQDVSGLLQRERCKQVLALPRGPEANEEEHQVS